jgi:hypothetical protein
MTYLLLWHTTLYRKTPHNGLAVPSAPVIHRLTEGPVGCHKMRRLILQDYMSLGTVMLFFSEIMHLLVKWTNRYCNQYLDMPDKGHSLCLTRIYRKCTCFHLLLYRWGMIRVTHWKITGPDYNSFHGLLFKTNNKKQILSYSEISTLKWQQKWT